MSDSVLRLGLEVESLAHEVMDRTAKFPRQLKYLLGDRVDNAVLDLAVLITDARYTSGDRRRLALREANLTLNRLRLLLRLSHQREALSHGGFEHLVRLMDTMGQGVGAWMKQAGGAT